MAKTIFEEMGGTYARQGDYLLPCLFLPAEKENKPIGVWGQRHLRYLKQHRKVLYTNGDCKCRTDLQLSRSGGEENLAAVFMYMTEKSKIYGIISKRVIF